jgi:23S rRNA (adenine2503-C2)-methyltransferase
MIDSIFENKSVLKGATLSELKDFFVSIGEPKYRGEQCFNWIYNHLAEDYNCIKNFPKTLREQLNQTTMLSLLKLEEIQSSLSTGTKKFLFTTVDGRKIESVLIPDGKRATLCISTQAGCPLDCKFCATGAMGFKRNLHTGEIVDQYIYAARHWGKKELTNIVYMGMGEPLLNFESTVASLSIFADENMNSLSRTRITVSTSGITPKITELADLNLRVKLALSLHSCFDEIRSEIMPVNKKFPIAGTLKALAYYAKSTKTRITFEYTMLKGINDRPEDLHALIKICKSMPSKVNIIPFNSISHISSDNFSRSLQPTDKEDIERFADKLRDQNITVMVRDTQGSDIQAACGQLAGASH